MIFITSLTWSLLIIHGQSPLSLIWLLSIFVQLLRANYLWDERYGQLEREFDDYQKGAAEAQRKASDYIFSLKAKVDLLQTELSEAKAQPSSYRPGGDESLSI